MVSGLCASLALASTTVTQLTVEGGQSHIVVDSGQILTAPNPSATMVQVQNNGTLIFWSGGGVHLEPGFRAASGSFFWAAVDTDMNGYSDQEEITDTDGDGMPDAWEVDHGLNPIVNDAIAEHGEQPPDARPRLLEARREPAAGGIREHVLHVDDDQPWTIAHHMACPVVASCAPSGSAS